MGTFLINKKENLAVLHMQSLPDYLDADFTDVELKLVRSQPSISQDVFNDLQKISFLNRQSQAKQEYAKWALS